MSELILIVLGAALVNNFVLVQFLGLCPFMGVSRQLSSAIGMGVATTFVLTLASTLSFLIDHWLLQPFDLEFLRTISFILIIATVVQFTEVVIRKRSPLLHQMLGIYLPLITTNCAVLGMALLSSRQFDTLLEAIIYGISAAAGFVFVLIIFASLRVRLESADVPQSVSGVPIALITAGIMSLAFMGFAGLDRGI
ncbi:MAG: electron transport complex subunit RsxA [Granulosicoccaceae bacterium]